MGICKLETFRYECDRCEAVSEHEDRDTARDRGWVVFPADERLRVRVLCPTCALKLDRFLMGKKTPVGTRFNVHEQVRWEDSCT